MKKSISILLLLVAARLSGQESIGVAEVSFTSGSSAVASVEFFDDETAVVSITEDFADAGAAFKVLLYQYADDSDLVSESLSATAMFLRDGESETLSYSLEYPLAALRINYYINAEFEDFAQTDLFTVSVPVEPATQEQNIAEILLLLKVGVAWFIASTFSFLVLSLRFWSRIG